MVRAIFNERCIEMKLTTLYNYTVGPVWHVLKTEELARLALIMMVAAVAMNCCQKKPAAVAAPIPAATPVKPKLG